MQRWDMLLVIYTSVLLAFSAKLGTAIKDLSIHDNREPELEIASTVRYIYDAYPDFFSNETTTIAEDNSPRTFMKVMSRIRSTVLQFSARDAAANVDITSNTNGLAEILAATCDVLPVAKQEIEPITTNPFLNRSLTRRMLQPVLALLSLGGLFIYFA